MLRTAPCCYSDRVADEALELEPLTPFAGRRMEQAIAAVRAAIDDGRMKPGVKYSVYQLAEGLGISRTPVRDALLRLEEVGVIKFEARQASAFFSPSRRRSRRSSQSGWPWNYPRSARPQPWPTPRSRMHCSGNDA